MMIHYIHRMGWFVGLVLLQVLILNNVHIAGYATPFLYVYFILKFASGTSRNELMLWAFFLGLTIDSIIPSIRTMGIASFLKFTVTSVFVHHLILLTIEFFSFSSIPLLLLRVVACTLLTVTCIMAVEGIRR